MSLSSKAPGGSASSLAKSCLSLAGQLNRAQLGGDKLHDGAPLLSQANCVATTLRPPASSLAQPIANDIALRAVSIKPNGSRHSARASALLLDAWRRKCQSNLWPDRPPAWSQSESFEAPSRGPKQIASQLAGLPVWPPGLAMLELVPLAASERTNERTGRRA